MSYSEVVMFIEMNPSYQYKYINPDHKDYENSWRFGYGMIFNDKKKKINNHSYKNISYRINSKCQWRQM